MLKAAKKEPVKKTASKTDAASRPASDVPVYSLDELTGHSLPLLGVKPEVLTGAVHGTRKEVFNVQEAKQLVQQFLKRKVQ